MPDIVITEFMDDAALAGFVGYDVVYDKSLHARPDEIARVAAEARALVVRNQTQVRGALLQSCRRLEAVGRLGVGLDNIDVEACRARGVEVLPATGANDVAVAEYVIAGALMLLRGAYFASTAVADGIWPRNTLIGREVSGKTLGLIGYGGIARQVATRAAALGMRITATDPVAPIEPPVVPAALDELLAAADVVSLHVPLTPQTRGLIGAPQLARMKPGAILINTARGGVVDEAALAAALVRNHLGGAMLDVFAAEPLPRDNPFHGVPNLILTPHFAGVTEESNARVSAVTVENVRRVLEKKRS
jgi:(S)-sulfolactate dehydrogenase